MPPKKLTKIEKEKIILVEGRMHTISLSGPVKHLMPAIFK